MPGYYKYISTFYESSTTGEIILMYNCAEQEGSIEKDFFVRPQTNEVFLSRGKADMQTQFMSGEGGERLDDAFYFIQ